MRRYLVNRSIEAFDALACFLCGSRSCDRASWGGWHRAMPAFRRQSGPGRGFSGFPARGICPAGCASCRCYVSSSKPREHARISSSARSQPSSCQAAPATTRTVHTVHRVETLATAIPARQITPAVAHDQRLARIQRQWQHHAQQRQPPSSRPIPASTSDRSIRKSLPASFCGKRADDLAPVQHISHTGVNR